MPSVFVILRSAVGFGVSVSVAVLFEGVGSVVPTGAVMVAVVVKGLAVTLPATLAVMVYVAVAPDGRFTNSLIAPVPLAMPVAPVLNTAVHVPATPVGKG